MADAAMIEELPSAPDSSVSASKAFGFDTDLTVPAFSERSAHVPDLDETYQFDPETTRAILAGFSNNRRVMIQGYHGTGKSTHIEQVAARLNWPCVRVNLDSHISRIDLIGKDAIVLQDGKQVTTFKEGILPWALRNPVALVFDEYDAGRPDVMFVIQRILEAGAGGRWTAHTARSERSDQCQSTCPTVCDGKHGRSRRYDWPLSWNAADQSGPDGPLVDGRDAQLSAPCAGNCDHQGEMPEL